MRFTETELPGVWLVESDIFEDERGAFIRAWVAEELEAHGLEAHYVQGAIATNRHRGTIRGLHYQAAPHEQAKLIRSIRGRVFDVVVDLRPDSPTRRQWIGVELDSATQTMIFLPRGVAHGYQTLTDDAEVFYLASTPYAPESQRGLRWDDPAVGIDWPLGPPTVINARDSAYPDID
jgi:dTDP-4-dehydrorhamnose 3,5-epimerase